MISLYPRPLMKRDSFYCLNGTWDFEITHDDQPPRNYSKSILVPYPPESRNSGVEQRITSRERMYYRKVFQISKHFLSVYTLLHFGGVDQECRVWMNGVLLGEHKGGYTSFSFDISKIIREGNNELIVMAIDTLSHTYPWGKQKNRNRGMWYTPFSGIWQTVWIESVPGEYITGLKITPSLSGVTIDVETNTANSAVMNAEIDTPEGVISIQSDRNSFGITFDHPRLWTPEDPYLYRIRITLGTDQVSSYSALRTLTVAKVNGIPRILLNGAPYFFHGLLDQGYWENGICVPDDDSGYEKDILFAKALGFNTLRKHIRVEPETFYEACDRIGMIVFQDFVNNGPYYYIKESVLPNLGFTKANDRKHRVSSETHRVFCETMDLTVERLYNHPCIAYWTIYNEGWGQYESDKMYRKLKSLDDSRIIDSTSGWYWQSESDVDSYHLYFSKLEEFRGARPVVLSEFGGLSYAPQHKSYGYSFFKTKEEYKKALMELYNDYIIPAVNKGLCGAIYTQIADVEDEKNGLVSYDRTDEKVSPEDMLPIAEKLRII